MRASRAVLVGALIASACVACSTDQDAPCDYTKRAASVEVAAMRYLTTAQRAEITSYCERGGSGTVELFMELDASWNGSEAATLCELTFGGAQAQGVDGVKSVLIRTRDGSTATTCDG